MLEENKNNGYLLFYCGEHLFRGQIIIVRQQGFQKAD